MGVEKQKRQDRQQRVIGRRRPPPKFSLTVQRQTLEEEREFRAALNLLLHEMTLAVVH